MNHADFSSAAGGSDSPTSQIRSTLKLKGDNRTPIKHILIGTPQIVEFTTRRLEQAGYAQAIRFAAFGRVGTPDRTKRTAQPCV